MCKTKLLIADNHTRPEAPEGHSTPVFQWRSASPSSASQNRPPPAGRLTAPALRPPPAPQPPLLPASRDMSLLLITLLSSLMLRDAAAWGANVKYAVNCPDRCSAERCGATQRCARTVLDDCGCCQVCAAGRGEHCYRTVSGMHGVKCGPGLFCEFYKDEDDYGDEYGICKGWCALAVQHARVTKRVVSVPACCVLITRCLLHPMQYPSLLFQSLGLMFIELSHGRLTHS